MEKVGDDIDGDNPGDKFGQTVSLSGDGRYLAIGALYNNDNGTESGQVRVFTTSKDDGDSTFIINGILLLGRIYRLLNLMRTQMVQELYLINGNHH